MFDWKDFISYATGMVNVTNKKYIEGNHMAYVVLLSGLGTFCVEAYPGAGHNYQAVVEGIHQYYRMYPEVKERYQEGIYKLIRMSLNFKGFSQIVDIILYELKLEQEEKASFQIDIEPIWKEAKKLFMEKASDYASEAGDLNGWLACTNEFAKERYGISIE